MKDNGNDTLRQFFAQAAKAEIPDNGFSECVIAHLNDSYEHRMMRLSHLWTVFFCIMATSLFFLCDAPSIIANATATEALNAARELISVTSRMDTLLRSMQTHLTSESIIHLLPQLYVIPLAISATTAAIMLKTNRSTSL